MIHHRRQDRSNGLPARTQPTSPPRRIREHGDVEPPHAPPSAQPDETEHSYASALFQLTRTHFPEKEAIALWTNITNHGQHLTTILQRRIAFETAACDYFLSIERTYKCVHVLPAGTVTEMENRIVRDDMTGLYNRRFFNSEISIEIDKYSRHKTPLSLLFIDIDHFKIFNDTYGHSAGDVAINSIANVLITNARAYDRVVRYGGEEFAVILPQTNRAEAEFFAERIRRSVENERITYNNELMSKLTVSIGIAEYPRDSLNLDQLIQCADKALYLAKKDRNKVASFWDPHRRHPRIPSDFPTSIWDIESNGTPTYGKAKNISTGGMLCETNRRLSTSSRIKLSIDNPRLNTTILVDANVERIQEIGNGTYHVGLSFIVDRDDIASRLIDLVSTLSSTSH